MREVCCSFVSKLLFKLVFVFFIFQFGVVGATLGTIAGAIIGWSNKKRLIEGITMGAVLGASLSYKLLKAVSGYLHSDDANELMLFVHVVKLIGGDIVKIIHGEDMGLIRIWMDQPKLDTCAGKLVLMNEA